MSHTITTVELRDVLTDMIERDGDQYVYFTNCNSESIDLMTHAYGADHEGRHGGMMPVCITRVPWGRWIREKQPAQPEEPNND